MKSLITLVLLVASTSVYAAETTPTPQALKDVECYIDNTTTGGKSSGITAKSTDRKPNDDSDAIWLRAKIQGFPGYYVQIWSYTSPKKGQEIDLRVKSEKQLGTYDMIAWASADDDVSLGVTLPGAKKVSFEISCSLSR